MSLIVTATDLFGDHREPLFHGLLEMLLKQVDLPRQRTDLPLVLSFDLLQSGVLHVDGLQ